MCYLYSLRHVVSGMEYAGVANKYCHCDTSFGKYEEAPDFNFNAPCSGDVNQRCGGDSASAVFHTKSGTQKRAHAIYSNCFHVHK